MRYKLNYKKHRNHEWKFSQEARAGRFVEGSHPEGHNWWLRVENKDEKEYTGKYLNDCKEQWLREIHKQGYWTSKVAKVIEQVFN